MKILFTIAALLSALNAMACWCEAPQDFKTADDLKSYDFIALITIDGQAPFATGRSGRTNGVIKMNVIELFKGTMSKIAFDPSFDSSCAMSLIQGEQWLFFGKKRNGKIEIESCGYTSRYRDPTGKRNWWDMRQIKELALLRSIFGKTTLTGDQNKVFYANGKLEIEQSFENGSLNGVRKIYYPNGQLYVIEKFENGKRVDGRKVYSSSGQLLSDVVYQNGIIKENIYYQDSTLLIQMLGFEARREKAPSWKIEKDPQVIAKNMDSLRKDIKWSELTQLKTYSNDGRSWTSEGYYSTGQLQYKGYLNWDKKLAGYTYYSKDGKLQSTSTDDKANDSSVRYEYKEDGTLKEYTQKCRICAVYFNADTPPQATPENVYIQ